MEYDIEIVEREPEKTLEVSTQLAVWKMPFVFGRTYGRIVKVLERQSAEPSGPPYARYLDVCWEELDKESKLAMLIKVFTRKWNLRIGFPVDGDFDGNDDMVTGELPGGRYVKTLHRGPYKDVAEAYKRLCAWITQEGITVKHESVEIYLNDPRTTKKEDLETVVLIPIEP